MKRTGVIGLGDMGSGLVRNLLRNGFQTTGFDLSEARMAAFAEMDGSCHGKDSSTKIPSASSPPGQDGPEHDRPKQGGPEQGRPEQGRPEGDRQESGRQIKGRPATCVADVARHADAVFVMVMNGDQAKDVILGDDGLVAHMQDGGVVLLTATIKPAEARDIGAAMTDSGIHLVDSPVSGGFPGAQGGTLTMMAAGEYAVLDDCAAVMEAVSSTIHRVGTQAGEGQTVKACLQSLIGSIFSATFEAAVLAARAGVPGEILYNVFSTSGAGCGVANTALENIIDRKFEGTGSHISTMHKDLTIALDMAEELGVPMHTAATAMQLFHAGKTRYPDGDNWVVTRVIEEIVGAELHRSTDRNTR